MTDHTNRTNRTNDTLLVIGYGSLLSGYGLLAERRGGGSKLVARDAFAVRLGNARRGFAKPSSHGHYLAMDLEPVRRGEPIVARAGLNGAGGIGAVGLVFDREWAALIARREEYDSAKFLELLALADAAGAGTGGISPRDRAAHGLRSARLSRRIAQAPRLYLAGLHLPSRAAG